MGFAYHVYQGYIRIVAHNSRYHQW